MPYSTSPKKPKRQEDRQARIDRGIELIRKVREQGCCRCGHMVVHELVFHHCYPDEKRFNIGQWKRFSTPSLESLEREMAKCEVVCQRCHRLIHAGVLTFMEKITVS